MAKLKVTKEIRAFPESRREAKQGEFMMESRRNKWRLLVLIVLILCIYSAWNTHNGQRERGLTNQDFIRFHVIANSDSDRDQELKQKVRDGLLKKINEDLAIEAIANGTGDPGGQLTLSRSREYIQENLDEIETAAGEILREEGCDFQVTAELGARFVPEKTYGNLVFPAGNYEALNVTIGEGKGHNWWCVLFPPLCLIGAQAPEEMDSDLLVPELLDPKYRALAEAAAGEKKTTLHLEFKTLDYMKRID